MDQIPHRWVCAGYDFVEAPRAIPPLPSDIIGESLPELRVCRDRGDVPACIAIWNRVLATIDSDTEIIDTPSAQIGVLRYLELVLSNFETRLVKKGILSTSTQPVASPKNSVSGMILLRSLEKLTSDIVRSCLIVVRTAARLRVESSCSKEPWSPLAMSATVVASWSHYMAARTYVAIGEFLARHPHEGADGFTGPSALVLLGACEALCWPESSVLRAAPRWGEDLVGLLPSGFDDMEWVVAPPVYELPEISPPAAVAVSAVPPASPVRLSSACDYGATISADFDVGTQLCVQSDAPQPPLETAGAQSGASAAAAGPALPRRCPPVVLDASIIAKGALAHQRRGAELQVWSMTK